MNCVAIIVIEATANPVAGSVMAFGIGIVGTYTKWAALGKVALPWVRHFLLQEWAPSEDAGVRCWISMLPDAEGEYPGPAGMRRVLGKHHEVHCLPPGLS